jgi:hypothetical protein
VECNERLKIERGGNRTGENYGEGKRVFRSSSPLLDQNGAGILRECPVGMIMREAPGLYELIGLESFVESGNLGPRDLSRPAQRVLGVASSERRRHQAMKTSVKKGFSDSAFGQAARASR